MTRNTNLTRPFSGLLYSVTVGKETPPLAAIAKRCQYQKLALVLAVVAITTWAATVPRTSNAADWKTGEPLRRELASRGSVTWQNLPLRDAMASISEVHSIAIMLDRRVDPSQKITYSARDFPLNRLLSDLAGNLGLGVAQVGDSLYIGPADSAARLPAIIEARVAAIRKLPANRQRELLANHPLVYRRLSTPNEVTKAVAKTCSLRIVADPLPHDLWLAGDFPPMNVAESLTLASIGFGKTFELSPDGSAIRWIDLPDAAPFSRKYAVAGARKKQLEKIIATMDGATAETVPGGLMVKGDWRAHYAITAAMRPKSDRPVGTGESVYSITIERERAADVLAAISQQAGFTIKIDPAAKTATNGLVSFEVKDATLTELLAAILEPVNLQSTVTGKMIQITPKP